MQVSTFAINYKGHPFKDSLLENRKLLYCLLAPLAITLLAATEIVPGFNWLFELVEFPSIAVRGPRPPVRMTDVKFGTVPRKDARDYSARFWRKLFVGADHRLRCGRHPLSWWGREGMNQRVTHFD